MVVSSHPPEVIFSPPTILEWGWDAHAETYHIIAKVGQNGGPVFADFIIRRPSFWLAAYVAVRDGGVGRRVDSLRGFERTA